MSELILDDKDAEKTHLAEKLRELADRLDAEPDTLAALEPAQFIERLRERASAWEDLVRDDGMLPDAVDTERESFSHLLERAESRVKPGERSRISAQHIADRIELIERSARFLQSETDNSKQGGELERILEVTNNLGERVRELMRNHEAE